jgi:DNA-binding FrmR family transcriptional regulator
MTESTESSGVPSVSNLPDQERAEILARLKRIEGQAKGVHRMVEEGRDCVEVMTQIASMKAATTSLNARLLEDFALYCLRHPAEFHSPEEAVRQVLQAMVRAS